MSDRPVVLVTGGSRGIGAAVCRLAAAAGCDVAVNYASRKDAADEVVAAVAKAGGAAIAVKGDVASEADVMAMFAAVDQRFGRLDGLVNNAGVVASRSRVEDMSYERLRRMMDINVIGAFLCAREAVRRMSTARGGRGGAIVNVSSIASVIGAPGEYVDYAASKGAIDTLTRGLAREVAEEGIKVSAVRPGIIDTEIHGSGGQPDRVAKMQHMVPMKRGGTAEEVAETVVWLLAHAPAYATGAIVDISGGR